MKNTCLASLIAVSAAVGILSVLIAGRLGAGRAPSEFTLNPAQNIIPAPDDPAQRPAFREALTQWREQTEACVKYSDALEADRRNDGKTGGTMPVKAFLRGHSPFGCYDMCGNVWHRTESERSDGRTRFCILRGGSYFAAKGSGWYVDGGPRPADFATKFLMTWPGLDRAAPSASVAWWICRDIFRQHSPRSRERGPGVPAAGSHAAQLRRGAGDLGEARRTLWHAGPQRDPALFGRRLPRRFLRRLLPSARGRHRAGRYECLAGAFIGGRDVAARRAGRQQSRHFGAHRAP